MRVYLDMVGCRLNQAEIERMSRQFRAAGHQIVAEAEGADLAVVNTCAVTNQAAADSRGKLRRVERAGADHIVATGCWATLAPDKAAGLPGVTRVVPNQCKDALVAESLALPIQIFNLEPIARQPLPGMHKRTRAFIKVQDGCDNRCTFCVTTLARGPGHSRTTGQILADIQSALNGGAKEIVLTGVHLGSWGQNSEQPAHLIDLIGTILQDTDVPRLRLSSLEPWDLNADFFALWKDPRLCPHLHLPLQSGCAATLRRMARKITPDSFRELMADARSVIPEVAITTDVIVGFPGETDQEFAESLDFIREMGFASGHAFTYSARPGTAAARMPDQVLHPVRKQRNAQLRAVFDAAARDYAEEFLDRSLPVLWESALERGPEGWLLSGLTGNYLRVTAYAPETRWNQIDQVHLTGLSDSGMKGKIE
jgi:threonylcarbamoyladenosine tRNA methylthiotransferase MtaB